LLLVRPSEKRHVNEREEQGEGQALEPEEGTQPEVAFDFANPEKEK
jgi:hypothetical protein